MLRIMLLVGLVGTTLSAADEDQLEKGLDQRKSPLTVSGEFAFARGETPLKDGVLDRPHTPIKGIIKEEEVGLKAFVAAVRAANPGKKGCLVLWHVPDEKGGAFLKKVREGTYFKKSRASQKSGKKK